MSVVIFDSHSVIYQTVIFSFAFLWYSYTSNQILGYVFKRFSMKKCSCFVKTNLKTHSLRKCEVAYTWNTLSK